MLEEKVMRAAIIAACSLVTVFSATSARADDQATCVDAFTQSQLLRDQKRLLSARDLLRTCMRRECLPVLKGRLVKECTKMLADVEAALPSLVFEAKDGNGNDLSAVQVTMDGQPLADKLDGSAIEVDPGEHKFTFDGGNAHVDKTVVVRAGDDGRHVRVVLGAPTTVPHPPAEQPSEQAASSVPTAALVSFGAGGVGLVVGIIFTVLGVGAKSNAASQCPSGPTCPPGVNAGALDSAITGDTVGGAVGYGVALVGAAAGTVILLTSGGPSSPSAPQAGSIDIRIAPTWSGIEGRF
jgi:hypothetical protein